LDETSQPIELLLSVSRDGSRTLGAQIEDQLRRAIRDGTLRRGAGVPSTRDLARQIGVSRRVVVDAYAQLAAEGYLSLRQGARPRVSETSAVAGHRPAVVAPAGPRPRFDFRPSLPDVSTFPRAAWLRSLREALATITDADLGYGDPRGVQALRLSGSPIAPSGQAAPTALQPPAATPPTTSGSQSRRSSRRFSDCGSLAYRLGFTHGGRLTGPVVV
jgi:GntR family transcriptional regulator / MocR family aminotransferase